MPRGRRGRSGRNSALLPNGHAGSSYGAVRVRTRCCRRGRKSRSDTLAPASMSCRGHPLERAAAAPNGAQIQQQACVLPERRRQAGEEAPGTLGARPAVGTLGAPLPFDPRAHGRAATPAGRRPRPFALHRPRPTSRRRPVAAPACPGTAPVLRRPARGRARAAWKMRQQQCGIRTPPYSGSTLRLAGRLRPPPRAHRGRSSCVFNRPRLF